MKLRELVAVVAIAAILVCSGYAKALGLGAVKLKSKLHQPLKAEINLEQVKDLGPTEIFPNLASQKDFEKAGIQRPFSLTDLRFRTELRPNGTGVIHITSTKPIQEPFLNFLLEVHWPSGRLLREYTFLMDPPSFSNQGAAAVQPPRSVTNNAYPTASKQRYSNKKMQQRNPAAVDPAAPQYPDIRKPGTRTQPGTSTHNYQVRPSETLWQIADRVKPGRDVSVQQTMLAIQYLNPDAFVGNNINRLKKGVVLRVPDRQTALAVSFEQALWEVSKQNRAWQQRRRLPQIDAKRRQQINRPVSVSKPDGKLSIVSSGDASGEKGRNLGGGGTNNQAIQDELIVTREQLDKLSRENNELKSRLRDLDEQIKTLNKLLTLKNDQMAALQTSAEPQPEPVQETVTEPEPTNPIVPPVEVPVAEKEEIKKKEVEPKTAPVKEPQPRPIPEPIVSPEPGFIDSLLNNPVFLLIVALIPLAGAGGYIFYRRRQNKDGLGDDELLDIFEFDEDDAGDKKPELFIDDDLEFEDDGPEQTEGPSDTISEADAYIAYGRFEQAAELLENAIVNEPQRTDLKLKLLETYTESNDIDNFKKVLASLEQMGNSDALATAEAFKVRFPEEAFATESVAASSSAVEDFPDISDDFDLDDSDSSWEDASLDNVDLDLGETEQQEPAAVNTTSVEPESSDAEGLDFDLGVLDEPEPEPQLQSDDSTPQDQGNTLEFNTEGLDLTNDVQDQSSPGEEVPGLDFDSAGLDLGSDMAVSDQSESMPDLPDLELGSLGEDIEAADTNDVSPEDDTRELSDFVPDMNFDEELGDDMDFLSDGDEVATKLDLARAYIDMGDRDGASDILDEVLEQGSENQQEEARELLDQL